MEKRKKERRTLVESWLADEEKLQAQFGAHSRRVVVRAQTHLGHREENVATRWHDTMSGVLFIAFK